jgi:hypothetical protein
MARSGPILGASSAWRAGIVTLKRSSSSCELLLHEHGVSDVADEDLFPSGCHGVVHDRRDLMLSLTEAKMLLP